MSTPPTAPPTLLTADEFAAQYARHRMELVRGFLKVLQMPGAEHGMVCMTVGTLLSNHVRERQLGRVMGNDTFILTSTNPDTVRGADVLYVSYDRLPKGPVPRGVLRVPPELVVEVRSPTDGWPDTVIKVGEYLKAGVSVVVVLDIPTASASVFRDRDDWQQVLDNGDDLTLPDVLPGFSVPVRSLFE